MQKLLSNQKMQSVNLRIADASSEIGLWDEACLSGFFDCRHFSVDAVMSLRS